MTADQLIDLGLNVVAAIAILVVGWVVAGWVERLVRSATQRNDKLDATLVSVFARVARWAVIVFTLIAVLDRFGVQTTSLVALLGAAGLAVGLALQGALSNVAAGVMILGLRPFRIGDAVDIGGTVGAVEDVGLFVTKMRTFEGVPVFMPNGRIWGNEIKNFSRAERRRIDLTVGVGYGDDLDRALAALTAVVAAEPRILAEPEPLVKVNGLGDSAVDLLVRVWTLPADFLATQMDLTKAVKQRLDAEGISIPFPQRDVHVIATEPTAAN
ncbi:MAG: mechanosensitive ion channel [Trueperaceae bacterium]|nr:mechanosensitive ion channel [Trueperaceae bacterium]